MINLDVVALDGFQKISQFEISQFVGEEPFNPIYLAENLAEKEQFGLLKRAEAGLNCFLNRSDFTARVCESRRTTGYKAPAGYHDYDKCYEIFLFSSGCWSSRVSLIYGTLPVHITGGGALQLSYGYPSEGDDSGYGYARPVLVTGTTQFSTFIGEEVDNVALACLESLFAKRVIKGEALFDNEFITQPSLLWAGNAQSAMEADDSTFRTMFRDLTV